MMLGPEDVGERERGQGGVAPRGAAVDGQPPAVGQAALHRVEGGGRGVLDVRPPPGLLQLPPVPAAEPRAAAVVHVQHREAPGGPVLRLGLEHALGAGRGPAVQFHQQRGQLAGERLELRVGGGVVPGVAGVAVGQGEPQVRRRRDPCGRQRQL
eukprot:CAMPEP_0194718642 /NCGR_PEP_ID=MMETSP0296-20130528/10199_1 /TAXON_ID=39354 /ORGANISM="Heterosigma akashiwo, Strain CCMP2393" /LENGTH=153 /DNA_ID=CAMNT_0039620049 /DNA_START=520 /DNA_END=982 /DNA_ORIENTATION=-